MTREHRIQRRRSEYVDFSVTLPTPPEREKRSDQIELIEERGSRSRSTPILAHR